MASETGQERTEQATPKKLRESREKGQVPRSKELNTMAMLVAAGSGFLIIGESALSELSNVLKQGLSIRHAHELNATDVVEVFGATAINGLLVVAPIFGLLVAVALLTPIGIGGWSFSWKAISFKIEKLNPIKGLARVFSWNGIMELMKVLAKFGLVASVSGMIIWSVIDEILNLGNESVEAALTHVASLCGWTFISCSSVLIIVAAIDVPFQVFQHKKQLKMTKQEVKDENKETDGRPEVKGRIRSLQQEMSRQRMMEAVPDADVVITNPTHYAVALRYDEFSNQAPIVVAKGADLIALQIRTAAKNNNVAIVEAPPLARALYASTEIDQEIPAGLYLAIATILTYVYQLKVAALNGEFPPDVPEDYPIPDELKDVLNPDEPH